MTDTAIDRLTAAVRDNALLPKLETMARELTGGTFFILWCKDDKVHRLCPDGREADLPKFCRMTRSTEEGAKRCSVCRSLVAVRACYHGLTDYCCHGGISVIAAPVSTPTELDSGFLVVSSCAFADSDREEGWNAARKHAEGLPIDARQLRTAYHELPRLEEGKARLVRSIVDIAACVLGEVCERLEREDEEDRTLQQPVVSEDDQVTSLLRPALAAARDGAVGRPNHGVGSSLTEIVIAVVGNDPSIPFTAANVARAARMTPNHFSTVFHKNAGVSFKQFLSNERINLACALLSDPTIPVSEVALRTGFDDPSYFSRRFKQVTGESPREFRERLN